MAVGRSRGKAVSAIVLACLPLTASAWGQRIRSDRILLRDDRTRSRALSNDYLENDLVAILRTGTDNPRLCAVNPYGGVVPLCVKADDVETDLFADPRLFFDKFWEDPSDENVVGTFGEGFYGQRPVPSLGGGPGYGADANEVWSVSEDVLEEVRSNGVELPVLDMGIAHGEKARGGSF
jgi:hypothetical protein